MMRSVDMGIQKAKEVCVCIYMYMYMYVCVSMDGWMHARLSICPSVCIPICLRVCMYICMCVRLYVCMLACICVFTYSSMYYQWYLSTLCLMSDIMPYGQFFNPTLPCATSIHFSSIIQIEDITPVTKKSKNIDLSCFILILLIRYIHAYIHTCIHTQLL